MRSLQTRTNALCLLQKTASFKTRKLVANGIWHSKLCYIIAVYGGTEQYILNTLQCMQYRVARIVCNRGQFYSSEDAIREIG